MGREGVAVHRYVIPRRVGLDVSLGDHETCLGVDDEGR